MYHDWGELPAGIKYGNTHGVCEDSHGQIYIHHTVHATSDRHDTMVVFDQHGKFVRSWGAEFEGGAHGLHIRREGSNEFLYLCDTKRAIVAKATTKGEIVWQFGYPKESPKYPVNADGTPGIKYSPTNIAIAPNGDFYVGDGYGSSFINQYDSNAKFIRTFGGKGKDAGQLDCPHGLMVDVRGATPVLMVADRSNKRIQTFSLDGTHLGFVEDFPAPCHFNERQGVIVVPDLFARVTLIDRQNKVIEQLGDAGRRFVEADPRRPARRVPRRQVRLPAQRVLRSRGQHLRRGVGRGGQGNQAAQSLGRRTRERRTKVAVPSSLRPRSFVLSSFVLSSFVRAFAPSRRT